MNEKLQYAEMLDMPTCSVTIKPAKNKPKRKKKVEVEQIKETLIEKLNNEEPVFEPIVSEHALTEDNAFNEGDVVASTKEQTTEETSTITTAVKSKKPEKKRLKVNVIALQFCIIGALSLGIFLTNALMPSSALNRVFGANQVDKADTRIYTEFSPELAGAMEGNFTMNNGVISIGKNESVYSAENGVITSVSKDENGLYTVCVEHSTNFRTVFSGLDYVYSEVGGKVLKNVPVGYTESGNARMCFYGADDTMIVNFTITDNAVIWAV